MKIIITEQDRQMHDIHYICQGDAFSKTKKKQKRLSTITGKTVEGPDTWNETLWRTRYPYRTHGSGHILVDAVIHSHGWKETSGACDGDSWMKGRLHMEMRRVDKSHEMKLSMERLH